MPFLRTQLIVCVKGRYRDTKVTRRDQVAAEHVDVTGQAGAAEAGSGGRVFSLSFRSLPFRTPAPPLGEIASGGELGEGTGGTAHGRTPRERPGPVCPLSSGSVLPRENAQCLDWRG